MIGIEEFEEKVNNMEDKENTWMEEKAGWLTNIAKEFLHLKTETEKEIIQVLYINILK